MPVAFLRAINVGGRQVAKGPLCALFESLGFTEVSTYLASGNLRFRSRASAGTLEQKIETALEQKFGFVVETFVRSEAELQAALAAVPFSAKEMAGTHDLWIAFLKAPPEAAVAKAVAALSTPNQKFRVVGRELYWLRVTREQEPKVDRALNKLLRTMTARNIRTVTALAVALP